MNKHDKTRYVFAQAIKGLIKVHPLDKIAVTDIVTRVDASDILSLL